MASDPEQRIDPRQARTQRMVLAAARSVLRRDGLGGATIDAIAARAGVARSTIYRNWSTREALLAAAFDDAVTPPTVVDANAPVDEQVRQILHELAAGLGQSEWGRTLPAVVAAIEVDPSLADGYGRLTAERRVAMSANLAAAVAHGDLPADTPVDDLVDALVGPLFYRRLIRQVDTGTDWIDRHVGRTLAAYRRA